MEKAELREELHIEKDKRENVAVLPDPPCQPWRMGHRLSLRSMYVPCLLGMDGATRRVGPVSRLYAIQT